MSIISGIRTTLQRKKVQNVIKYGLPALVLITFPAYSGSYAVNLLAKFLTYGILALSLDLLWGYSGVLCFAQAVFFGLGSYGLALSLKYWGNLPGATYIGLVMSVAIPSLLALFIGYVMFFRRVGGVYFAIVTFALGAIVEAATIVWINFTGGANGLFGFSNPHLGIPKVWEFEVTTKNSSAYFVVVVSLLFVYFLSHWLVHSPLGQTLRAINDNEDRAETLGYKVPAVKLAIFVISCAVAGLGGALYVPVGFVSSDILGILFSTSVIVWVTVGGRGTLYGAVLGALVVNYLQAFMSDVSANYWYLSVGIFFIVVVLIWPSGIIGIMNRIIERLGLTETGR